MKIVIVDYGMGNVKSLLSALQYIGQKDISITSNEEKLLQADKVILPGVGAFNKAIESIKDSGLDLLLHELAVNQKKPMLGICLGMQLLGSSSCENGSSPGLQFIDGTTGGFDKENGHPVPHIGYNQVVPNEQSRLYRNMGKLLDFYFVHSYKMSSSSDITPSFCDYGGEFVASFEQENIAGVQFHPELSQKNGLQVLENFIDLF